MRPPRPTVPALLGVALAALFASRGSATACPICLGDPNSPITKSAEMGVWFLLAVILLVEAGFGVFFVVYLRRRARGFSDPMPRPALRLVKKGV